MKLHTIAAGAVGACATVFTSASFAVAYDSDVLMSGKAQRSHHAVLWNAGDCATGGGNVAACDGNFQGFNETTLLFNVSDPAFNPDHSHSATATTNISTGSGSPDIDVIDTYYPECTAAAQANGDCLAQNDSAGASVLGEYNIDVAADGKILDGFAAAETNIGAGVLVAGYSEWINGQTSRICTFGTSAANLATDFGGGSGFTRLQNGDSCSSLPVVGPANLYESTDISYATCNPADEACGFAKAVPVPAFAAAALGLGLVGITLATRRRKSIS